MTNISAIIVVKDNPPHLSETILSIDNLVSEIIIGDIDIDESLKKELCKNKKVKIIDISKDTPYADIIKEELKKRAKYGYLLYLDPDEIFPTINNEQLTSFLQRYDYLYFPRKNIILGKWIQHSRWWPDYQLRLYKKDAVIWPKELHPVAKPKGKGFTFAADEKYAILHFNYDNLDQYLEKARRYAKSEAEALVKENKNYSLADAVKQATAEFMSRYFSYEGYRDGMHGFILAVLQMFYYFLVYSYYWEEKKYFPTREQELVITARKYFFRTFFETNYWIRKKKLAKKVDRLKLRFENIILKILK